MNNRKYSISQISKPCGKPLTFAISARRNILENVSTCQNSNEIEVQIRNILCSYSLPLHIDLRRVALNSAHVMFQRNNGYLLKQKRNPECLVRLFSNGKVCILGCRSQADCKTAARQIGRLVQRSMNKLSDVIRIRNYRINNVLATCKMPFGVKIEEMAKNYPQSNYEPEISVGLTWRSENPKATLRIHTTGSVTVTGEKDVVTVIENIYPILKLYSCATRAGGDVILRQPIPGVAPNKKRAFKTPIAYNYEHPSADLYASKRLRINKESNGVTAGCGNHASVRSTLSTAKSSFQSTTGIYGDKMYFSDEEELYEEFGFKDLNSDL